MSEYVQLYDSEIGDRLYPNITVSEYNDDYGAYRKYANGRLEVEMYIPFILASTKAWGSLYITDLISMPDFPSPFITAPKDFSMYVDSPSKGTSWLMPVGIARATTPPSFYLVGATTWIATNWIVRVRATGKWK